MYRTVINGKEVIVKLSTKLGKEVQERTTIYEAVLSVVERVLPRENQYNFAVHHKNTGLIIGEVHRGEVIVFSVEHIVDQQNIFQQHINNRSFEQGANF